MEYGYSSEYLLIFSEEIRLSKNEEHLKKIIEGNGNFEYKSNGELDTIIYNGCEYNINIKKINSFNDKYRNYLIKINGLVNLNTDEDKYNYREFNKELVATIKEVKHSQLNTLKDTLASEYSFEGYKQLHEIENKMRKLITIFMTTKVGLEWISTNMPQGVFDSIKNDEAKKGGVSFSNFLSETDFIQLSNFLFNTYNTLKTNDLQRMLKNDNVDLEKIKEFIPKSNWERYFSSIIETRESSIIDWWEWLYDIRNKIAHNRFIEYEEYRRLISTKDKINAVIDEALQKIDSIEVTGEQQKEITVELEFDNKEIVVDGITSGKKSSVNSSSADSRKDKILSKNIHQSLAENTVRELSNLIYSNIDDSFKKELRKYRNRIRNSLSNFNSSPINSVKVNMLQLETQRARDYIKEINAFISL